MTLTTHAVVGAAIVRFLPTHPLLGICLAFASHFLLDALPHWDYPIRSLSINPQIAAPMKYDRALLADMLTIGGDATLGIILALVLFTLPTKADIVFALCGAAAAMLPDVLQFVWMRFPREPLMSIQRFHEWIHTSRRMREHPFVGVVSQVLFILIFAVLVRVLAI